MKGTFCQVWPLTSDTNINQINVLGVFFICAATLKQARLLPMFEIFDKLENKILSLFMTKKFSSFKLKFVFFIHLIYIENKRK